VGLSFVVVYKASRVANFAVGEFVTLASRLVAAGLHLFGLGLGGALAVGCAGMMAVGVAVSRGIFRRLAGQPLMTLIMATIGLGTLMRGSSTLVFAGLSGSIAPALPAGSLAIGGVPLSSDKVLAAVLAGFCVIAVSWFFRASRTGLALRAIASDPHVALGVGIDLHRHAAITWALVGVLSVAAGTLWTLASGGGFGLQLLGLKVFPIVILGGLDSVPGAVIGAFAIGVLESLAAGYLDPFVGGGFSRVTAYLVLLAALLVRPHGLFGHAEVRRI
jgi:branched-chain amino acid transport system permease protein